MLRLTPPNSLLLKGLRCIFVKYLVACELAHKLFRRAIKHYQKVNSAPLGTAGYRFCDNITGD